MLEHAIWCQGKGDKKVTPLGSKMFPLEMERSMKIRGTVKGELAYQNDPWMKANTAGFPTFKLCELYDQQQLKTYASKPRAKLVEQFERLQAKLAVADQKLLAALADPHTSRVNSMKVKEVKQLVHDINTANGANTIDTREKVNGEELEKMLIAYYKSM